MSRLASVLLFVAGVAAAVCFVLAVFQPERLTYDSEWHLRPAFEGEQAWKYGLLAILSFGFGGVIFRHSSFDFRPSYPSVLPMMFDLLPIFVEGFAAVKVDAVVAVVALQTDVDHLFSSGFRFQRQAHFGFQSF